MAVQNLPDQNTALAVQNAPDQNTALAAYPRKRRAIFAVALKVGMLIGKLALKAGAMAAKLGGITMKKAFGLVGKGLKSKGLKWTVHHGSRVVKKGYKWVRKAGRLVKQIKEVREELVCNYKRYGNNYLEYSSTGQLYPESTGEQEFT